MQRLKFLLSKRWALFLVAVVLLTWLAVWLGQWQFGRLEDRKERNASVLRNEALAADPVEDVLSVEHPVAEDTEWRHVTATGTYLPEETVHVRYRTGAQGAPGVEVLVPMDLGDGTAVIVDRGWWGTANRGAVPDDVPAPPSGEVTVDGWVRVDAEGDSTAVKDHSTRAVNSVEIAKSLDLDGMEFLQGFVQVETETPAPAESLTLPSKPELNEGPHFFYGIQWWFFGFLAVAGFGYLLWDEWRDQQDESTGDDVAGGSPDPEDA
ncbi:SURF1 family protein [Nocardioides yefusunii]|uniref:SURF1-like protein n=1 Tax=Nocardioides yefusunii TaxID=2500546 RepID=A0ABW1QW36_9ACTN|nr:SURF1 family cytochrome oxidase biogenesis protein [Nocardioides yefusunii]